MSEKVQQKQEEVSPPPQGEGKKEKTASELAKEAKQRNAYSLARFTILIVEDYPFMSELVRTMLREFGVGNLFTAENAENARNILRTNNETGSRTPIDIVLVDWLMPDGNGVNFIKWIRNHKSESIKFLPTILCSAYASEDVVITGRDNGANEALVKPVAAEKLAKRLLYVIDNPRPFVKAPGFFGPDRRRKDDRFPGDDRRKISESDIEQIHEEE
jgi:two-component system chemotaxis response regulator CheY